MSTKTAVLHHLERCITIKPLYPTCIITRSVVDYIFRCCTSLLVSLDYFIHATSRKSFSVTVFCRARIANIPASAIKFLYQTCKITHSIVDHIFRCCAELLVSLNYFVHCIEEVLLCYCLPPGSNSKHSSFSTHTSNVRSC